MNPIAKTLCLPALLSLAVIPLACDDSTGDADYELILLHTNDRHSHWLGQLNCDYDPSTTDDGASGGAARWMPLVDQARAEHDDVLLLDAGDFTMGTMLVAADDSAGDLNMMKELGFDAAALGNHEFDWRPAGLARMIEAADEPAVPLLCANIEFDPDDPADDALEALYGETGKLIHPHIVIETPSGIKVGLFGLMGLNAASVSNARPVTFSKNMDEMASTAQAEVDTLLNDENVDLVILLTHAGIGEQDGVYGFEAVDLARQVEGIDAILSGHTHTVMPEGIEVPCEKDGSDWTTLVMEAGDYGTSIGRWTLLRTGGVKSASSELITVDDSMAADPEVTAQVDAMIDDVEQNFLPSFGGGDLFQRLTCSDCDLQHHDFENNNLGYLLADAVAEATGAQLAAISNGGDLRAPLPRCADGCFDLSDMFIAVPLGIGPDGLLGYPLVTFYMKWSSLKMIFEATIAGDGLENNDYMLNLSGMRVQYDTSIPEGTYSRIIRIEQYDPLDESAPGTLVYQKGDPNDGWHVVQTDLISVSVSLYIAQFLADFDIKPLDENGQPVVDAGGNADLVSLISRDDQDREFKSWYLLAEKLSSMLADQLYPYCDEEDLYVHGPYWRRMCDLNPGPENSSGHTCP